MNLPERQLIVSLHDVAAVHLPLLRKAEGLLRRLKISEVQYLFVPEFHGRYRASEYPEFIDWCRRERSFAVSWWLHGFYHQDRPQDNGSTIALNFKDRLKRKFLTGGEGEFLALDVESQRRRLVAGLEEFSKCFQGAKPVGFVPPAWLFRPDALLPLLRELDMPYTESHQDIFNVKTGTTKAAPVITWATRTVLRKYGSLIVCPWLASRFREKPVIRVALHPHDFDHTLTTNNIEYVIRTLKRERTFTLPEKLDWG